MPIYLVRCDFREPERTRATVDAKLATLSVCLRPMADTWIVEDATSASIVHTMLKPDLGPGDRLLIVRCGSEGSWHDIDPAAVDWLQDRMTRDQ